MERDGRGRETVCAFMRERVREGKTESKRDCVCAR